MGGSSGQHGAVGAAELPRRRSRTRPACPVTGAPPPRRVTGGPPPRSASVRAVTTPAATTSWATGRCAASSRCWMEMRRRSGASCLKRRRGPARRPAARPATVRRDGHAAGGGEGLADLLGGEDDEAPLVGPHRARAQGEASIMLARSTAWRQGVGRTVAKATSIRRMRPSRTRMLDGLMSRGARPTSTSGARWPWRRR